MIVGNLINALGRKDLEGIEMYKTKHFVGEAKEICGSHISCGIWSHHLKILHFEIFRATFPILNKGVHFYSFFFKY